MNVQCGNLSIEQAQPVASIGCCLQCGKTLQARGGRGRQKSYCDARCKNLAQSERKKGIGRADRESTPRLLPDGKLRRTCLDCGRMFVAVNSKQMYCSNDCGRVWRRLDSSVCVYCGKTYTPKRGDRTTYCSRQCAFDHKNKQSVDRELIALRQVRIVVQNVCHRCGGHVEQQRLRCDECNRRVAAEKALQRAVSNCAVKTRTCAECSVLFQPEYGNKRRDYCSLECCLKKHRRIAKTKRRARKRAVAYESIDPIAVFERDDWRCHICGGITLPSLRGSIEPDAPELDHVVALANGGSHTYSNVACSHRRCNQEKGANR